MMRSALLWASQNHWLSKKLPRRRFVKRAVTRFMPGESVDEALRESETFNSQGIGTILTLLGENLEAPSEADAVADHYLGAFSEIRRRGLNAEISIKPTQLGLDLDPDLASRHLEVLAAEAEDSDGFLWIDMEGSSYVDVTLELFREVRREYRAVGLCLQAYLHRTPDDLESLLPLAPAIRLVKGAYAEPAEIAYPKKSDVDDAYFSLSRRLLEATQSFPGTKAAFGTHDLELIERIGALVREMNVDPEAYEFEMLFGIRREAQSRLAKQGIPLRVLISYGEAWFPWYMRRLAERPANVGFVLRSMFSG